ncbi:DUF3450 domain-containing protein [Arcobacter sp. F2176]|uniref:DUF3450 domain-containing protein n=1 Tax=Arcobacter sp. F2176 TaxID=2044511 RepID=UPI00100C11C8|nr:DUF3450 domain-containing protein [Arcobacter sp. F2176]RXJ81373.1 hypothetical protein CRU95_07525 [Arcobacter sp. F2176]
MFKPLNYLILFAFISSGLFASDLDKSLDVIQKSNNTLQSYQKKIDKNEDIRETLFDQYKQKTAQLKNTQKYNEQLEKIFVSQKEELQSMDQQLIDIEQTKKNIYPLMLEMISSLKVLIKSDTPFLLQEREDRVKRLEESLTKADIKTNEKFRIILEAFKIEYDYAKTIEAYQEKIGNTSYNILRLGRVALYYQSLDLKNYGYFNKETNKWEEITDSTSKSNIRTAIKIAKKQGNVTLLNLPFLAKKEAK